MKKSFRIWSVIFSIFILSGCASGEDSLPDTDPLTALENSDEDAKSMGQEAMYSIRVTAGDAVLDGVIYDNPTARNAPSHCGTMASGTKLCKGI